jgi:hypothetical protein
MCIQKTPEPADLFQDPRGGRRSGSPSDPVCPTHLVITVKGEIQVTRNTLCNELKDSWARAGDMEPALYHDLIE